MDGIAGLLIEGTTLSLWSFFGLCGISFVGSVIAASLGLGGGSIVYRSGDRMRVGPESLGYRIVEEGLVFGGDTLTFTDVAVSLGVAKIGNVLPRVSQREAQDAYDVAVDRLEDAIDRIKTGGAPMSVVAVGGGSSLLPDRLSGVLEVLRPPNFDVANAIGAATARVSGRVDRIYAMAGRQLSDVLDEARQMAEADAIRAGADPGALEVVEVEEIPLAYLLGNASRVRVRVAGDLLLTRRQLGGQERV